MKKEINYLEIEDYLQGELTGEQLRNFKDKMNADVDFAKEVALYKDISNTLESRASNQKQENDLRNTLEDLETIHKQKIQIKKEVKIFRIKRYSKLLVAASLVLFASLLWMNEKKPVYGDFSNHPTMDLIVRGDSVTNFTKVQTAFNSNDYILAEQELQKILQVDGTKVELQLYLAIALLEQDKFSLAESILEKIKNGNSIYKNKAIWYLALSKLKQEDYKNATNFAKLLPKDAEDYDLAQKLLKKM